MYYPPWYDPEIGNAYFGPYSQDFESNKMYNPRALPQVSRNLRAVPRNDENRNGRQRSGDSRASTTNDHAPEIRHRPHAGMQEGKEYPHCLIYEKE